MRRIIAAVVLAAVVLGAGTVGATAPPSSPPPSEPPSSTLPLPDPNDLTAVHEHCTGEQVIAQYQLLHDDLVGAIYQDVVEDIARNRSITPDDFIEMLLDEMFNAAEETLTIGGAWARDDECGLTETGFLFGLVYDCVLEALEVPERVRSHIGSTRALDGMQEDSWDDYNARWTYHPDAGITVTIWR